MVTILEQIELTDTTTTYQVTHDHIDLDETLDQSYERHRAALEQEERSNRGATLPSNATPLPAEIKG